MRQGDLVRFKVYQVKPKKSSDCGIWEVKLGILVEYKKWEKIASVFSEGSIHRIRAEFVTKAGRRDKELISDF